MYLIKEHYRYVKGVRYNLRISKVEINWTHSIDEARFFETKDIAHEFLKNFSLGVWFNFDLGVWSNPEMIQVMTKDEMMVEKIMIG